ncbi:DUF2971 domain-containing protein [Aeromonas veronii]|uniref:DUF2971 domain-containing protein n=1 Tax=Aeromonas veronii TaxID=654 RepID=UPI001A8F030D|nr:DUF2971 domain-containing protein [Aeromonas veronii]MBO0399913.1 DUF2971 domain-containing protein [Aeromonas veronii]
MALPSRQEGFREGRGWGRIPPVLLHGGGTPQKENMRTLYKYYKSLPDDYLLNPTLKLACPEHLNDPFESSISKLISEIPEQVDTRLEYFKAIVNNAGLSRSLSNTGVISMSETHRNLLMWAHYANEHKGFVIGYKDDILNDKFNERISNIHNISKKPLKVNYDTVRFDSKSEREHIDSHKKAIRKILTTKGDDWIYEKEHRYLIPIYLADTIDGNEGSEDIINALISKDLLVKDDANKNLFFKDRFTEEPYLIGRLEAETYELIKTKHNFYINIDPSHITSIYFGCRYPKPLRLKWLELIRDHSEILSHIKLYQYDISKSDFSLIYEDYEA